MKISCGRFSISLKKPYGLSFATITECQAFFAIAEDSQGRKGWGEVSSLHGYSWETDESIASFLSKAASLAESSGVDKLKEMLEDSLASQPFAVTPMLTALEMLEEPQDAFNGPFTVPLTALLSGSDEESLRLSIASARAAGQSVLKLKVGAASPDADISRLMLIKGMLPLDVRLRLDANQACSFDGAKAILKVLDNSFVELFEQPFKPDEWDMTRELATCSKVPLMLDESIWTESDIRRAAKSRAASVVKLKLFKHGSPKRTVRLAKLAESLGLGVILGNGVQTEAASLLEASIFIASGLDSPGEMNGGFKLVRPVSNVLQSLSSGSATFSLPGAFRLTAEGMACV